METLIVGLSIAAVIGIYVVYKYYKQTMEELDLLEENLEERYADFGEFIPDDAVKGAQ